MKYNKENKPLLRWTAGLAILVVLCCGGESFARDVDQTPPAEAGQSLMGVNLSAVPNSQRVYFEDFENGPADWTTINFMNQWGTFWHQTTYNDGVSDRGVMWCGTDASWFATPPGYGNYWRQYITKTFELGSGTQGIAYEIQWDTEPEYDYVYVAVSNDGFESYTLLDQFDGNSTAEPGNSQGFVGRLHNLSQFENQTIEVRFIFASDGGWSDEDGIYESNGAARLDWVEVAGYPRDDFETGTDGWTPSVTDGTGDFRIEPTPVCEDTMPCPGMTNAWVAYDPETGVFPFAVSPGIEHDRIDIQIRSPWIDIPPNATSIKLNYDLYANLPVENLVFYYIKVLPEGYDWTGPPYVYWSLMGYHNNTVDLTDYIPQGVTRITINLGAVDRYPDLVSDERPGDNHTSAPMFDNVAVWVTLPPDDPSPMPNLTVQNYTASPNPASIIDLIRFDVTVRNTGPESAWSSVMNWRVGSEARQFTIPEGDPWTRVFDAGDETFITRAVVWDNHLYLAGLTRGSFPGHTNAGGWDAFVQRRDLSGSPPVWTDQFGTPSDEGRLDIVADDTGVYVCGAANASLAGEPWLGGSDAFVRKYDHDGNVLWTNQFGTITNDVAHGISLRGGMVLVCGETDGTLPTETSTGGTDAFVNLYSVDGLVSHNYQFGTAGDEVAVGLSQDETGATYTTGYISGGAFNGQTSYGDDDVFVQRGVTRGEVEPTWRLQFGTSGGDRPTAITIDDSGVYVAGYCTGALPGQTHVQGRDAFVRKYDRDGNELWTDQFGSQGDDQVFDLEFFNECVVAAGKVGDPVLVYSLPGQTGMGKIDNFVRRYWKTGGVVTTSQFGTAKNEFATAVAIDGSGMYVAGAQDRQVEFTGLPGDTAKAFVSKVEDFFGPNESMAFTRYGNIPEVGLYDNVISLDYTHLVYPGGGGSSPLPMIVIAQTLPNLELTSLTHVPLNPTDNDTITFTATVTNSTTIPIRSSKLNFKIADEAEGENIAFPPDVWTSQFGTGEMDKGILTAAHASGIYVLGRTQGTFPGETNYGQTDYFLTKFDYAGNIVWSREFGGAGDETRGRGIAVDGSGVYVCGEVYGDLPGQSHGASAYADAWVRKYDHSGTELWTHEFGSLTGYDRANGLCLYDSGLYVCGTLHDGSGDPYSWNPFLRKYDLAGNVLWTQQFTVPGVEWPYSVSADESGIYMGGFVEFEFPGQTYGGNADAYVRQCDLAGNEVWAIQFGGANWDHVNAIKTHPSGIYVIGNTQNSLPGYTLAGPSDTYAARLDRYGAIEWLRQFGSYNVDHGLDFEFEDLTLVMVGYAGSNLPGHAPLGGADGFVRRYDLLGTELATDIIGTSAHDELHGIAVCDEGVFITGHTNGVLSGETSAGGTDAFVMKYQDYIQGGESVFVTRNDYFPVIGNYTASATADALNIIVEADEGDNTATDSYTVVDWDSDDDGVPDPLDLCPFESALNYDSNGDGCIDDGAGGRHVEYWERPDFPITYYINEEGAPGISDGSDFTAIHNSMNAWTAIPGTDASVIYGGTTPQKNADALDGLNIVTFEDTEFQFGLGVLAVGITTSFEEPTVFQNKWYRPGQICDSDMIFNRSKQFRTATGGPSTGTLIDAVGTHEAGHVFGLSHSAVLSSTMYFVLQPDTGAATLATEDKVTLFKAYGTEAEMAAAGRLGGVITDGYTGGPLAGAAVFAIDAADGDTVALEYTLPHDGSYLFVGLPDGDYYVGIHPLNGSANVGYIQPGYINHVIAESANTVFVPEWWDAGESQYDDPEARTAITVAAGAAQATANLTTNIDDVGPEIVATVPAAGATDVSIGGSILVTFNEPVNSATLQGNFSLINVATGEFAPGNAAFLNDDMLIAYVPAVGLEFSATYRLTLGTGLQDLFGNGLDTEFEIVFDTEAEPPVALTSLAPSKGTEGIIVSVNGKGFDPEPASNTVTFNGVPAVVSKASATQLVVTVPAGTASGVVNVFNHTQGLQSNDLQFTVLSTNEVPKGFESGVTVLGETPRAITVLPDASYAFMATDFGAQAVVVDPSIGGYLTAQSIPISGGLDDIDAAPSGNRVYGVSWTSEMLYRIDATPGAIGVLSEHAIGAKPRGILVNPRGNHAFIPTDEGEIQIWDVDELSPSFLSQVGRVLTPDPNIRGEMATDPTGERLLALSGMGKLLVFDLVTKTLIEEVPVGPDPRDVAVDPRGHRAYISDETGVVSIVSLEDYVTLQNIRTGGTLRGIAVTPGGTFTHAVNRELNILNAIDLRESSPTFRSVAATIPLPINPVDIEISPDGEYAFTVSEAEQRLVVTTIGLGPSLSTISRSAGPAGATLVFSGSDFAADSAVVVSFGGVIASPRNVTENAVVVDVPQDAASGPASIVAVGYNGTSLGSNSIYFDVIGPTLDDALRLAARLPGEPSGTGNGGSVMCVSPNGKFVALGDGAGGFHVMVTDRDNSRYHQYTGTMNLGEEAGDIVISSDNGRAFAALPGINVVRVVDVNMLSDGFLSVIASVDFSGIAGADISKLALSPDGSTLLVSDPGNAQVHFVDVGFDSPTRYQILSSVGLATGSINGIVRELVYHPGGDYVYLPVQDDDPAVVHVMDTNIESPAYQTIVYTLTLPGAAPQEIPLSISFTPNGERCLVLTGGELPLPNRSVIMLDTSDPAVPVMTTTLPLGGVAPLAAGHIDVSPRGDRAIASVREEGYFNIAVGINPDALALIQQAGDLPDHTSDVDNDYAPDASVFYSLSESSDNLLVYDFSTVQNIAILSGDGQTGVIDDPLPMPLQVQVSGSGGSVADVPVTFTVTSGGGYFAATNSPTQTVTTDDEGIAEASWTLGDVVGAGAHTVEASSSGLVGSPLTFTANALDDPLTLPLLVTSVTPQNDWQDVSVSTAIQITFSRPVDPGTVNDATVYLHPGDQVPIPVVYGFSDYNRRVSMSPRADLAPETPYTIEITVGILDEGGGALAQPVSTTFATEPTPQLALGSIAPSNGARGAAVVLSGVSFNPDASLNKVLFGNIEAIVRDAGKDFIDADVPLDAPFGTNYVRVVDTEVPDTSNSVVFTVRDPSEVRPDDVVSDVKTGSATRSVAISPDGAFAYGVSPYANVVVPISLVERAAYPVVPVGENPVAISLSPDGTLGYVANHVDGTVTIFNIDSHSPDHLAVVDAVGVGLAPTDLAITPDGDRLIVVNYGSNDLSVLDTDPLSATFHSVVSNPKTGSGTRTVAISPDGGLIYLGTDTGYLVVSAAGYSVVSDVKTGNATRTVSITPDGAFLILLTSEGVVDIFDIHPDSPTRDQVVASVKTGSGTRTVGISPDGGLMYLIQEASDIIIVAKLTVSNSVSVIEDGTDLPPTRLSVALVDTLTAGEDPAAIAFSPVTNEFVVTNAGDQTMSIFGIPQIAQMTGGVFTDTPQPKTPLVGVELDLYDAESSNLIVTLVTDENGSYFTEGPPISYTLTIVTPLGYSIASEESLFTAVGGDTTAIDFALVPETSVPDPRKMSFWKHQIGVAYSGVGISDIDAQTLCGYLDLIEAHFNSNRMNPVVVYQPEEGIDCEGKLLVAKELFRCNGWFSHYYLAKQQLMSLLLNVSAGFIHLSDEASRDGATVSQAITYVDHLIDDGNPDNDKLARDIALRINLGHQVNNGIIPIDLPDIAYTPRVRRFHLGQNVPNPFNPSTTIKYEIAEAVHVRIKVYDVAGRLVRTLVDEDKQPEAYEVVWDGNDRNGRRVASGVYFYKLEAGEFVKTKKMVLLK